jgi:hypothetical protein
MKTVNVDPRILKFAPFNSPMRTTKLALDDLMSSMKRDGFWKNRPIDITQKNIIIDGHRRVTCALELKIFTIPAYVHDGKAEELWSKFNSAVRVPSSRELYWAAANGLTVLPNTSGGRHLQSIINTYGMDMIRYCSEHGVSRSVFQYARSTATYLGHEGDTEYIRKIVYWLVDHRYVRFIRLVMEDGVPKSRIAEAIEKNDVLVV